MRRTASSRLFHLVAKVSDTRCQFPEGSLAPWFLPMHEQSQSNPRAFQHEGAHFFCSRNHVIKPSFRRLPALVLLVPLRLALVSRLEPRAIVTCVKQSNHQWLWSALPVDHGNPCLPPDCPGALSPTFHCQVCLQIMVPGASAADCPASYFRVRRQDTGHAVGTVRAG
jgi:hypothetical protein